MAKKNLTGEELNKYQMDIAVNGALFGFTEAIINIIDEKAVYCLEDIKNYMLKYQKEILYEEALRLELQPQFLRTIPSIREMMDKKS